MANQKEEQRPIIIKKVKGGGHGHHGGAWKVAYADFVTAMMAFFLLLWLLSTASEESLRGIADYFSPTYFVTTSSTSGSQGVMGGVVLGEDGSMDTGSLAVLEIPAPPDPSSETPENAEPTEEEILERLHAMDDARFDSVEQQLMESIENSPESADLINNVMIDKTPEGLRITLVDDEGRPLFESGRASLPEHTKRLITLVTTAILDMPNKISISGHTDATPFSSRGGTYGNWELSSDRANASRRVMLNAGLQEERMVRVVGRAARDPLYPETPDAAQNRRISIVLLYLNQEEAEEYGPDGLGGNGGAPRGDGIRRPAPNLRPSPAPFRGRN